MNSTGRLGDECRPPRNRFALDKLPAVRSKGLIVDAHKLSHPFFIWANDRVNGFAEKAQEFGIRSMQQAEAVVVKDPVRRPIVVPFRVLMDVAGGILKSMVMRGEGRKIVKTAQEIAIAVAAGPADPTHSEMVDDRPPCDFRNLVFALVEHRGPKLQCAQPHRA